MAENGIFRISFRGFHKQDVLQYIDELQTSSVKRLADVEARLESAQALAESEGEKAAVAQQQVEELKGEVKILAEQVEKLTALARAYKREVRHLREQVDVSQSQAKDTSELDAAQQKIAELEERCALLTEQNARFSQIVGDVSRLVVEARVVSSSYFDAAHQKSVDCIEQLEAFLSALKSQAAEARETAAAQRRGGEEHIESLLADLQGLGVVVPED